MNSQFTQEKEQKMKTDKDDNLAIEKTISDIQVLYPGLLVLSPRQLSKMRGKAPISLYRERLNGVGPAYKVSNKQIIYPVRAVAIWLNNITQTA